MSSNAATCSLKSAISTNTSGAVQNLKKVSKRISQQWMILLLFSIIFSFFTYLIFDNCRKIFSRYKFYIANMSSQSKNSMNPDGKYNDNEVYDKNYKVGTNKLTNNDNIVSSVENIKSTYKTYNDLIKRHDPESQDIIDEKMISSQFDDYKK